MYFCSYIFLCFEHLRSSVISSSSKPCPNYVGVGCITSVSPLGYVLDQILGEIALTECSYLRSQNINNIIFSRNVCMYECVNRPRSLHTKTLCDTSSSTSINMLQVLVFATL